MCEKLLKDFDLIPKSESKDSTFFEICGIDNELSTVNNVLAFFFDSSKGHSLQELCVESLINLINEKDNAEEKEKTDAKDGCKEKINLKGKVTCKKNVPTINNNTIDFLITSDDVAIIIETAIHPDLHNKFSQSFDCIETDKRKYGVVLSVNSILNTKQQKYLPNSYDFITYGDLFAKIRENIKEQDKNEYAMCLLNYMENKVKELEDISKIGQRFADVLMKDDNASKINKLVCNLEYYFGGYLNKILEEICDPVIKKIEVNISTDDCFKGTKWKIKKEKKPNKKEYETLLWNNDEKVSLYRSRYVEFLRNDSYTIKVYIYLSYDGCYFEVLISKEGSLDTTVKKDLYTSLHSIEKIKWIKRDRCDFSFTSAPFCKLEEAEAKSEKIANKFCEIVETICKQDF